jgi:hypothetical protein
LGGQIRAHLFALTKAPRNRGESKSCDHKATSIHVFPLSISVLGSHS